MPHQEKRAWLMIVAMAVTFGPYFAITSRSNPSSLPGLHQLGMFAVTVIAQVIILIVGHIVLAIREPREEQAPPDERDRAIERRSMVSAYYVLICGMILVGCVMPFKSSVLAIVNAALLMIVIAELVHYGVVVWNYRRQA